MHARESHQGVMSVGPIGDGIARAVCPCDSVFVGDPPWYCT